MSFHLFPDQSQLYADTKAALSAGYRRILVTAPTGFGKTVFTAHMFQNVSSKGYKAWFINHRVELIGQSFSTLTHAANISCGVVCSGYAPSRHENIQICMVATLARRMHLMQSPDLIVVDEAHHIVASTWAKTINAHPKAVVIGLTATPERLDGRGLGEYFQVIVQGPTPAQLIANGRLSPYRMYAPSRPDLSGVHQVAGDFNKKELSAAMNQSTVVGDALAHYKAHADGKRGVGFAYSVEASKAIAAKFNEAGIPSAHIDGATPRAQRDAIVSDMRTGRIRVLWNVEIVTEGFDLPEAEIAIILRPTQSFALWRQMIGRVLRPAPGKTALIFDHSGNAYRHGLPDDDHEWSLEGKPRKKKDTECPVKQCGKCYAMIPAASMTCKYCGFVFQAQPRDVSVSAGELTEVDKEALRAHRREEVKKARTFEQLVDLGKKYGYTNADTWALHTMNGRSGAYARYRPSSRRAG